MVLMHNIETPEKMCRDTNDDAWRWIVYTNQMRFDDLDGSFSSSMTGRITFITNSTWLQPWKGFWVACGRMAPNGMWTKHQEKKMREEWVMCACTNERALKVTVEDNNIIIINRKKNVMPIDSWLLSVLLSFFMVHQLKIYMNTIWLNTSEIIIKKIKRE